MPFGLLQRLQHHREEVLVAVAEQRAERRATHRASVETGGLVEIVLDEGGQAGCLAITAIDLVAAPLPLARDVEDLGTVGGSSLAIEGVATVALDAARKAYEGALPKIAGDEA